MEAMGVLPTTALGPRVPRHGGGVYFNSAIGCCTAGLVLQKFNNKFSGEHQTSASAPK